MVDLIENYIFLLLFLEIINSLSLSLPPHFFLVIILYLHGLDLLLRYYNEQLMNYQLQYMPKKFV